jgi:hypothetical protein
MHSIKLHGLDLSPILAKDDGYRYTFANVGGPTPARYFNSEHKSSGAVVRTCKGVSTDSGPWRSITENFGHDDLQFATYAYRRYVVGAVEPEISSGDSTCSCV